VSRAGYYKWLGRGQSKRHKKRASLLERIIKIFEESRQTYGCPRMYAKLRQEGYHCNYKQVERLMKEHEITPKRKRKFKSTTDSRHNLPISPNVLAREFEVKEPDEVWVSDITYIETQEGWLYLAVFIDLYSRLVVGWSMSSNMTAELVVSAFEMARARRGRAPVLVHSDQGSQYASWDFRQRLNTERCLQSMSRRGNCWDNAVSESFFGTLKSELVYRHTFKSRKEAELMLFDFIEIFYNNQRIHSALGYVTPSQKAQKGKKVA
jgi:transposase InsO family protein